MSVVLVLTNSQDGIHSDVVIEKITTAGSSVIRLDTDRISRGQHQLIWQSDCRLILDDGTKSHVINEAGSIWLRRPKLFDFSVVDREQKLLSENEFNAFLTGVYMSLETKRWLNTYRAIECAKLKVYQLKVAKEVGLLVPNSIVTANPRIAREFCTESQAVFKPLVESNFDNGIKKLLIPTTLIDQSHIDNFDLIQNQYILLQKFVAKDYELRITFVDGKFFVAKQLLVDGSEAGHADWRLLQIDGRSYYEPSKISKDLESKITNLMRVLNLNFATLDFAVDSSGDHYFLEANPNGQWYGYTDEIGLVASDAIVEFLVTDP